jgi:2,3-bisphosphoglycerate-dependent phosphoglycerate mutase
MDSGLTELGERQAQAMAGGLKKFRIDLMYSSDLGRAARTATIISESLGRDITTDTRLRERNLGILQGLTMAEFASSFPQEAAKMKSGDPDYAIPGGESARQRHERCVTCVEDLCARHPGRSILLVVHGGVLMSFMNRALAIPLGAKRTYSLYNGAINVFTVTNAREWTLETWGETNHMRENNLETIDDN